MPIGIDLYSDLVCPWCYVGQRQLDRALAQLEALAIEAPLPPLGRPTEEARIEYAAERLRLPMKVADVEELLQDNGINPADLGPDFETFFGDSLSSAYGLQRDQGWTTNSGAASTSQAPTPTPATASATRCCGWWRGASSRSAACRSRAA